MYFEPVSDRYTSSSAAGDRSSSHPNMDAWPIVGRANESRRLMIALLEERGAIVSGPPGVGKTTLVASCLQSAEERGMVVVRFTATPASRATLFGVFASLFTLDHCACVPDDYAQLLRTCTRSLVEVAGGRPLVVHVDDAHLLDDGSATLLHQLALTRTATVVATVRTGEPVLDSVVALWKDGLAERLELGVLDDAALAEVLVSVLGGPVDAATMAQLVDRAQGVPLYLRELVTGSLESGSLARDGGIWRLRGSLQPTRRLVELIALRLGALSDPERGALELLVIGGLLEQGALTHLADAASLDSLERKGLIVSRWLGRRVEVSLAHPLYGDVVRLGITAARAQAIAHSLVEVLERTGARRSGDTLAHASLHLVSGGGSAQLLLAGARAARPDHRLAEQLARAAVDEDGSFEARLLAAESAHFQGRPDQAERELADLATQARSDAERARVAVLRFDNAFLLSGRADLEMIDREAAAISDPTWRAELLGRLDYAGRLTDGPRRAPQAATISTAERVLVGYGLARHGRIDEALRELSSDADGTNAPAVGDSWDRWSLYGCRAGALVAAGRFDEAEELLAPVHDRVVRLPDAEARAFVAAQLATLRLEQGRVQSAFRLATEAHALFRRLGRTLCARWSMVVAAQALALTGLADEAGDVLRLLDAFGLPAVPSDEASLVEARAWVKAAAGDLPSAYRLLQQAADLGEEVGDLVGAASALHGLARLGRAGHVAGRLAELVTHVDGALVAARAAFASALADHNATQLEKVAGDFEELGALLYAAEALAETAVLFRQVGESRRASAAERRAERLLAQCEGAATPPVLALTARAHLDAAELDTALHAAAGRSNKQIAHEMYVSVRTVENRLQRAYEKLGVSGRHELADALDDQSAA